MYTLYGIVQGSQTIYLGVVGGRIWVRLGCIRFSAKRNKSPWKPPRIFLSPAGFPRMGRGVQALVTGHDPLQHLLPYHYQ